MKKNIFKIIFAVLLMLCISGCFSSQQQVEKVEGTYYVTNGLIDIFTPEDSYQNNLSENDFVIKFYNENNYIFVFRKQVCSGTYNYEGGIVQIYNVDLGFQINMFELMVRENTIEFRIEGDNENFQIRSNGSVVKGEDVDDSYFGAQVEHTHEFSKFYSEGNNGCTGQSKEQRICYICCYVETQYKQGEHEYFESVIPATCTEDGYTEYRCHICGHSYKENIVPAQHNYISNVVDPTCEIDGYTEHRCQICGDSYRDNITTASHNWQFSYDIEATCDAGGYSVYTCTVCYIEKEDNHTNPLEHKWEYEYQDSTCEYEGYSYDKCDRCGQVKNEQVIGLKDHEYEESIVEATCTENGYTLNKCKNCNDEQYSDYVLAGCVWEEVSRTQGTCIEQGELIYTCTRGNHTKTEYLGYGDHDYEEVTIEATCTSDGQINYVCQLCTSSYVKEYLEKIPHECGEDGICTLCKDYSKYVELSYSIDSDTYVVSGIKDSSIDKIIIPSTYKGIDVSAINSFIMPSFSEIVIPSSIKEIYFDGKNINKITYLGTLKEWCEINFVKITESRLFNENTELYINDKLVTEITKEDEIITINPSAFLNYTKLISIEFADTVTYVSSSAFVNCTSLNSVIFPKDYKNKDNNTCPFTGCNNITYVEGDGTVIDDIRSTSLKEVTIHGTNTGSFANSSIEKVTILSDQIYFDNSAFNYCQNLNEIIFDGITLGIGENAFQYTNITSFEIVGEIEEIPARAFAYCTNLENVILPDSIKKIGEYAFASTAIKEIDLKNVEEVKEYAFSECKGLEEIVFPDSLVSLERYVLYGCDSVTKITSPMIGSGNFDYMASPNNVKEFILTKGDKVPNSAFYSAPLIEKLTLPNTITDIEENAFYYNSIKELKFNGTISEWCSINFENNYSNPFMNTYSESLLYVNGELLTSISESDNISVINDYALTNISSLESIELNDQEISIGIVKNLVNLDRLVLAAGLENSLIELYSEKTLSYLKCNINAIVSFTINAKEVEVIGGDTIENNFKNTEILKLHDGVTTISRSSFNSENAKLYYAGSINDWANLNFDSVNNLISSASEVYFEEELFSELNIPSTVTNINAYAFSGMKLSGKITIPETVKKIGLYAFSECKNITEVEWVDNGEENELTGYAFYNCSSLETVILPKYLTFENSSFGSTNVVNLTAPYSLMSHIYDLKYFHILGDGVLPSIYNSGQSIEEVVIGEGFTEISSNSFNYSCKNLKKITIPSSVEKISEGGFSCGADIYYKGTVNSWCQIDFDGSSLLINTENFYINDKLVEEVTISGISKINAYAFLGYNKLTKVVINSPVRIIGEGAFSQCENLKYLELPSTLREFENFAFSYNYITDVYYNGTVEEWLSIDFTSDMEGYGYLYNNPISECDNFYVNDDLLTVIDEINIDELNSYAFYNYEKLEKINKISGVSFIGSEVFYGCTNLVIDTLDISEKTVETLNRKIDAKIVNLITSAENGYNIRATVDITNVNIDSGKTIPSYFLSSSMYNVKTLIIGDTVEVIEEGAFRNVNLDKLEIGSSVEKIEQDCFDNTNIKEIVFKGLVTSMSGAFESSYVTTVKTAAENVKQISNMKITNLYVTSGEDLHVKNSSLAILEIVDSVTKLNVVGKEIGEIRYNGTIEKWCAVDVNNHPYSALTTDGKFLINGEEVTEVVITSGVERIGEKAFAFMPITSVSLGSSVKEIATNAFYNCTSLVSVNLSNGIEYIGDSAFYGCTNLSELNVPTSVKFIGGRAFYNTKWISDLTSSEISVEYGGVVYINNFLYTVNRNALTSTTVEVKDGTVSICGYAFYGVTTIKTLNLPDSVVRIEDSAFGSFGGAFNLPTNLEYIGNKVFSSALGGDVVIPETVTYIGEGAFYNCSSLTSIVLPDGLTEISNQLFMYCGKLTDVTMGNNVTTIGDEAFRYCYWLENINLSTSLESIGEYAFTNNNCLKYITLPESLVTIKDYAFKNSALVNITIPSKVTEIGTGVFQYAYYLESVELLGDVTIIKASAFENDTKLANINLPNTISSIEEMAFYKCESVQIEALPESLLSIGASAFYNCTCFVELDLSKIDEIGAGAFDGNSNLTKVTLSNNLEVLGGFTFAYTSLTEVYIPASVTSIDSSAFAYCSNLVSITVDEENTVYTSYYGGTSDFGIMTKDYSTILRAAGPKEGYVGVEVPNVKYVSSYAYSGLQIKALLISNTVEYIYDYAFANCTELADIYYGYHDIRTKEEDIKLQYLYSSAFTNCDKLSEIYIFSSDAINESIINNNIKLNAMTKYYYSSIDTGVNGGHYFGYKNNLFVRWDVDRWFE